MIILSRFVILACPVKGLISVTNYVRDDALGVLVRQPEGVVAKPLSDFAAEVDLVLAGVDAGLVEIDADEQASVGLSLKRSNDLNHFRSLIARFNQSRGEAA